MARARKKTGGRRRPSRGRTTQPTSGALSKTRSPSPRLDLGQPGRRPSSSGMLLLISVMWFAVGVVILTSSSASWKLVPGVVSIGIGLLFLRGGAATVVRRSDRRR